METRAPAPACGHAPSLDFAATKDIREETPPDRVHGLRECLGRRHPQRQANDPIVGPQELDRAIHLCRKLMHREGGENVIELGSCGAGVKIRR